VGRVTLSAVSIAGALLPWYVVRDPFALVLELEGRGSSSRAGARAQPAIGELLSSTRAGVRDPRAAIGRSRAAARGSRGLPPGPGSGRRVCHSVAVYVIRPGPFVRFRVCHSGACMFVIFRLSRAFSRDNGPRCTALRSRRNRAKLGPKNRPLCWLRGRMPNFRRPIGSQRERGYPGRKTGPG